MSRREGGHNEAGGSIDSGEYAYIRSRLSTLRKKPRERARQKHNPTTTRRQIKIVWCPIRERASGSCGTLPRTGSHYPVVHDGRRTKATWTLHHRSTYHLRRADASSTILRPRGERRTTMRFGRKRTRPVPVTDPAMIHRVLHRSVAYRHCRKYEGDQPNLKQPLFCTDSRLRSPSLKRLL